MQPGSWLRLTDYASKYGISISTLRRRIKIGTLPFRFEDGKYLIADEPPRFSQESESEEIKVAPSNNHRGAVETAPMVENAEKKLEQLRASPGHGGPTADEPILSSASRLLGELKRAYMSILQEKEEQIIQLKEEVSDLKTLVRVLEDDNERLRKENRAIIS